MPCPAGRGLSSQFKGVYWKQSRKKWIAQIRVDGKKETIGRPRAPPLRPLRAAAVARPIFSGLPLLGVLPGSFPTEEEAARRYDEHAARHGRRLNFPVGCGGTGADAGLVPSSGGCESEQEGGPDSSRSSSAPGKGRGPSPVPGKSRPGGARSDGDGGPGSWSLHRDGGSPARQRGPAVRRPRAPKSPKVGSWNAVTAHHF